MRVILASTSPRRRELLAAAGLEFEVVPSPAEELHCAKMPPAELCEANARLKAEAVAALLPGSLVIGADTLVFIDGKPLGKPADMAEARAMLRLLSGRTHSVCTGVCVINPQRGAETFHDITAVEFRELGDEQIEAYFLLVNPLDKAGAYGIQEHGELLVSRIDGNFDNVMGLPVALVMNRITTPYS